MSDWLPWLGDFALKAIVLSVMLVGLVGLIIPLIPGLVIIWVAGLGYGLIDGFTTLGWVMFALMTVLMIVGSLIDNVLMGTKAHDTGAPWWVVLVALIAGILGNFIVPIIGGLVAALLALFLLEWLRRKEIKKALRSLQGMLTGFGLSVVIRFIMGLFMIAFWLIWILV